MFCLSLKQFVSNQSQLNVEFKKQFMLLISAIKMLHSILLILLLFESKVKKPAPPNPFSSPPKIIRSFLSCKTFVVTLPLNSKT